METPIRKPKIYKTKYPRGMELTSPRWVMYDGWTTYVCNDWDDAMRKARRRLRGQPA